MKHFIVLLFCLLNSFGIYAQSESSNTVTNFDFTNRRFLFDVGAGYFFGKEGDVSINLNMTIQRWIVGLSVGTGNFWDLKGKNYSGNVGWNEYPSDNTKDRGKYNQMVDVSVGYHIWKNIAFGVGLGYVLESDYKNMYDKSHILTNSGDYHLKARNGGSFAGRVFVNCYLPLDRMGTYYILLSPQYSTYYNFAASVGIGFAL